MPLPRGHSFRIYWARGGWEVKADLRIQTFTSGPFSSLEDVFSDVEHSLRTFCKDLLHKVEIERLWPRIRPTPLQIELLESAAPISSQAHFHKLSKAKAQAHLVEILARKYKASLKPTSPLAPSARPTKPIRPTTTDRPVTPPGFYTADWFNRVLTLWSVTKDGEGLRFERGPTHQLGARLLKTRSGLWSLELFLNSATLEKRLFPTAIVAIGHAEQVLSPSQVYRSASPIPGAIAPASAVQIELLRTITGVPRGITEREANERLRKAAVAAEKAAQVLFQSGKRKK